MSGSSSRCSCKRSAEWRSAHNGSPIDLGSISVGGVVFSASKLTRTHVPRGTFCKPSHVSASITSSPLSMMRPIKSSLFHRVNTISSWDLLCKRVRTTDVYHFHAASRMTGEFPSA